MMATMSKFFTAETLIHLYFAAATLLVGVGVFQLVRQRLRRRSDD